ncbi:MAG: division/cell wall cluster transcriptional repressor MraZ [Phycisphaerae bacterium]
MIFTGYFEHTIDAKHRLAIPSRYRSHMDPETDGTAFVLVPGQPPNTLWLYTERHFERLSSRADSALIPDDDQLRFEQIFYPLAEIVEWDTQGRILVPERMMARAGLGREVVICGVRDHAEIRPREGFDAQVDEAWRRYREYQLKAREVYQETRRQSGPEAGQT